MDKNDYFQFFNYCYEGDLDNAKHIYFSKYIDIRNNNDKIFKFCCQACQDMYGYNEKFNKQSNNLLKIINFLCTICCKYYIEIIDDKLINWKIINKIIIKI